MSVQANPGGENDSGTAGADQDATDGPRLTVAPCSTARSNSCGSKVRSSSARSWTDAFAFESVPNTVAGALHPGAVRLIVFHIVAQGSCWVAGDDGERHWAGPGDVIVIPYGDRHDIGGETPADASRCSADGHAAVERAAASSVTAAAASAPTSSAATCTPPTRCSIRRCGVFPSGVRRARSTGTGIGMDPGEHRLRARRRSADECERERHRDPAARAGAHRGAPVAPRDRAGRRSRMARRVARPGARARPRAAAPRARSDTGRSPSSRPLSAVSRSLLDERFRQVLGRSPIRYLTEWRMHLAEELLATTETGVVAVAHRVGYESEEAFSRAFKRAHGLSPSHWRAARVDTACASGTRLTGRGSRYVGLGVEVRRVQLAWPVAVRPSRRRPRPVPL